MSAAGNGEQSTTPERSGRKASPTTLEMTFALGWHLAELRHANPLAVKTESVSSPLNRLPAIAQLEGTERTALLKGQIEREIATLGLEDVDVPDVPRSPVSGILARVVPDPWGAGWASGAEDAVEELHRWIQDRATIVDFRLGKAYDLGVGVAEVGLLGYRLGMSQSSSPDEVAAGLADLFGARNVARLSGQLGDLKSELSMYSAPAVRATLEDWASWVQAELKGPQPAAIWDQQTRDSLYGQVQAWRAFLSGEKEPTSELTAADYTRAFGNLVREYRTMALQFLRGELGLALGLLVTAAGMVAFLILWRGTVDKAITALIAFLGLFGVTTATVAAAVKRALTNAETQLWEAEIQAAVALAISRVPGPVEVSAVAQLRGKSHSSMLSSAMSRLRPAASTAPAPPLAVPIEAAPIPTTPAAPLPKPAPRPRTPSPAPANGAPERPAVVSEFVTHDEPPAAGATAVSGAGKPPLPQVKPKGQ